MHRGWDNTVIGAIVVSERTLVIETNSIERADALRALAESALNEAGLGAFLRHRIRDHQDLRPGLSTRPAGEPARPATRGPQTER